MRRTVAAIALVTCSLLAGCGLLGGSGTPTGGATSPTPAATAAADVPGVAEGRLRDPDALLAAHEEALVDSGFETDFRVNQTVARRGEVVDFAARQRTLVEAGLAAYQFRTRTSAGTQFDVWGNRTVQATRAQVGSTVQYRNSTRPASAAELTNAIVLGTYLRASGYTVRNVTTREERTLVTLSATGANGSRLLPPNGTDLRNYEATAVVDGTGRVLEFRASGEYTVDGRPGRLSVAFAVVRLDDPQVTRPEWVSNAL